MTDWMLIYLGRKEISSHRAPQDLKSSLNELFALFRLFRHEFHRGFLHGRHRGRRETRRPAQRATGSQLAQCSVDRAALRSCSHAGFGRDPVGHVQLQRNLASTIYAARAALDSLGAES